MNEIIRHIEYLLTVHDCVIVPGLGAILAHTLPARMDKNSGLLLPPSRTYSFNINLNHNDGLLVSSIARARSISFESARNLVSGEVENMRCILEGEGCLSLGLAGCLNCEDGVISFRPSTSDALSYDYMWLPSITLTSVGDLAKQRANVVRKSLRLVDYATHAARVAASLAVLLALAFVLSTPIELENAQYASLGIENFKTVSPDYEQSSLLTIPGHATSDIKIVLKAHDDACERVDTAIHAAYKRQREAHRVSNSDNKLRFNPSDNYYLIVASLANEDDAKEFVAQSDNIQLGILIKDGRYRIYAATGASLSEARSAAEIIADRYPSSWVCRK